MHLDSGTLTPLLKRLADLHLVERTRDPADERRVLVSLSAEGTTLRERAAEIPGRIFPCVDLDIGTARGLISDLTDIVHALESSEGADHG